MYLIAFELALAVGAIDEKECRRLTRLLQEMPEYIAEILENKEDTQYIASSLITADSLLYIGRGLDYALSMEGSLKLKEISYIHSESYARISSICIFEYTNVSNIHIIRQGKSCCNRNLAIFLKRRKSIHWLFVRYSGSTRKALLPKTESPCNH